MAVEKRMPQSCPSCDTKMKVKKLVCPNCATEVDGLFNFPVLSALSNEEQLFIIDFIKVGGSLKDMATNMKLSYPTIRNQLDDIIERVSSLQKLNDKK
ncbi:MAG: DUF2089 family protein [Bacteroidia bacterium]|nr:DUF2089 family protein [Bacteroidia bacterium]